ncbi:MAG: hypothetical protein IJR26_10180 [Bacteroidales bacterium]|nr:hypothetical protein [Bacteroidales bacterium]
MKKIVRFFIIALLAAGLSGVCTVVTSCKSSDKTMYSSKTKKSKKINRNYKVRGNNKTNGSTYRSY